MDYCAEIRALIDAKHAVITDAHSKNLSSYDRPYIAKLRVLERRQSELQRAAAQAFADLNGWRLSNGQFDAKTLASGACWGKSDYSCTPFFDHAVHFRENKRPYRSAAIAGQPYEHVKLPDAQKFAASRNLELHTPPDPTASWHYPGYTKLLVFTRPETMVRFC